ncbi:MAG: type III pantothenate kinase [Clostridia bacterium]|nr:type III pantothenate kinase [Clostridia bacterium]
MILAIDIGNSNIVLGVFKEENLLFIARLATDPKKTSDELAVQIKSVLKLHNVKLSDIDGAALSSVVPQITAAAEGAVKMLTGKKPFTVGAGIKTGMNILIDNPAQLGSDILVDCVAAASLYPLPCIVADMGTATVMTVVTKPKNIIGGVIIPGVKTSLSALVERTAQLPQVSIEVPKKPIGSNTVDCMKSGIVYGTAGMIDGIIERFEEELGEKCFVVATGGMSPEIVKHTRHKIEYNQTLLLRGLYILYNKNL